jgi:hypothetical protein
MLENSQNKRGLCMITKKGETLSQVESIQDDPAQEKENEKSDFSAAGVACELAEYTGKTALVTSVVLLSISGIMQKHNSSMAESLLNAGGAAGVLGLVLFLCTQAYLHYKSDNAPVARETPSWCDKGNKTGAGIELVSLQEEATSASTP